jgi:hypothetical protein
VFAVSVEPPVHPADEPVDPVGELIEPSELSELSEDSQPLARWESPDPTGVPAVDDALAPLAELDDLPTGEHVLYYETVHRRLQDALADLDSA